ncbi:MAG TPA: aldose 1-epimerase [Vicinamibacterales bacterium]|nr:aldose 1-epimerase [Vicinamibacterales bacterium]
MSNRKPAISALTVALILASAHFAAAQPRYSAKQTGDIVQLRDTKTDTTVSVMTSVSNAYEMVVKGQDLIRMTFATVDDFRARPGLNGIPLLAPFANRLDEPAFYANGKKYNFDMELGNVRGPIPIHGYLSGAKDWKMVEAKADGNAAWVTNQLDFYRNPQWMQQFPFAHTLTMTYRLQDGVLEVHTRIDNLSVEPMPVAIGFHPYFQLTDSTREGWTLSIGAKTHWLLAQNKIPTGETEPIEKMFPDRRAVPLKDFDLDDVYGDLERDAQGRAVVSVKGKGQQLDVVLGANYKSIVLYSPNPANARGGAAGGGGGRGNAPAPPPSATPAAPSVPLTGTNLNVPNRGFIAVEPMVGITDSMNLAQKGVYKELQSIPPGGKWEESFWLRPKGF